MSTNHIPDIFIRVYTKTYFGDDECIGYARFKADAIIANRGRVVLKWQKIRMVYTDIKEDSEKNYLGALLFSINLFQKDKEHKRPIYVESKNMKKYKLVSLIYMANDLPPMNSEGLADPRVEVNFNGKSKSTKIIEKNLNPVFSEALFISTIMSDNLELSDNVKVNVKDRNDLIGSCEISLLELKKYNHQDYIENEIYKNSKWYYLYNGTNKLKAKILINFFIVRLIRQGKEKINLLNKKFWPDQEKYRVYLYIIGVRNAPRNIDLQGCYSRVLFNQQDMEDFDDKEEPFNVKDRKFNNDLNNLDVKNY